MSSVWSCCRVVVGSGWGRKRLSLMESLLAGRGEGGRYGTNLCARERSKNFQSTHGAYLIDSSVGRRDHLNAGLDWVGLASKTPTRPSPVLRKPALCSQDGTMDHTLPLSHCPFERTCLSVDSNSIYPPRLARNPPPSSKRSPKSPCQPRKSSSAPICNLKSTRDSKKKEENAYVLFS